MLREDYTRYRSRLVVEACDERHLRRLAGLARFGFNWALSLEESRRAEGLPPLEPPELEERFREACRTTELGWVRELPSDVWRNALRNLRRAYKLHDEQHRQRTSKAYHRNPPQRRRRDHGRTSFQLSRFTLETSIGSGGRRRCVLIDSTGHRYRLHRTDPMPEHLGRPYLASVKLQEGTWFITLLYREQTVRIRPRGAPIGVDLGFYQMAVDSEGGRYEWRDLPPGRRERLRRLQLRLRRLRPGSRRHRRIRASIDRLRYRRRCVEWDTHHKASAAILGTPRPAAERPSRIVLDHLNLTEIAKGSSTLDAAVRSTNLYQLFLKLRHKAERQGTEFVEADRFYPSSKACSRCGHRSEHLALSTRTYACPECGLVLDRDRNAALNLRDYEPEWGAVLRAKREAHRESLLEEPEDGRILAEPATAAPSELPAGLDERLLELANRRSARDPIGQGVQRPELTSSGKPQGSP